MSMQHPILPVLLALAGTAWATQAPTLDKGQIQAGRITIEPAESGLPAQIVIAPGPGELQPEQQEDPAALSAVGRGAQLVAPIRIEIQSQGQVIEPETAQAFVPEAGENGTIRGSSQLQAGDVNLSLDLHYQQGGILHGSITAEGGTVERLSLVLEPQGSLDLLVDGPPVSDELRVYEADAYRPITGEGVVWQSPVNGSLPSHFFAGNGDRGWTLLTPDRADALLNPDEPAILLSRAANGQMTLRYNWINQGTALSSPRTWSFTLISHPSRLRPGHHRQQAWLAAPVNGADAATPALTGEALRAAANMEAPLRADVAGAYEAFAPEALLSGPAAGDAVSIEQDVNAMFPIELFRFLAGTHAGQVRRLVPNTGTLVPSGGDPRLDRAVLGRALLHDIGVDVSHLANLADAANLMRALHEFGFFQDDGRTEFLPYWRNSAMLSFGEIIADGDVFDTVVIAPADQPLVSAWRRPVEPDSNQMKVLILIVNPTDAPLRDMLFIRNAEALFGGPNALAARRVLSKLDFSRIPDESNWGERSVVLGGRGHTSRTQTVLRDVEDGGMVRRVASRDNVDSYGPFIYVPARGFRLFQGSARQ